MLTSAVGFTVVGSLEVLLARLGSGAVPLTVAVLVTDGAAAAPTPTVRVMVELPPEARPAALVQLTIWPLALHVHPLPVPETKLRPAGRVSPTVSVPDGDGPALPTSSV